MSQNPTTNEDWRCHGWADHQRGRFDATLGTTLGERLEWLEETMEFVRLLAAAPVVPAPEWARRASEDTLALAVAEAQAGYRVKKPEVKS